MFEGKKSFVREIIWYVLQAAMVAVLSFMVVKILHQKIQSLTSAIQTQRLAAFTLVNKNETIRQLQADLAVVGDNENIIRSAMPPADNVTAFKSALDEIAGRYSLQEKISFSLPSSDQKKVDFTVIIDANANMLISYLKDFEKLPFLSSIKSIDFQSKTNLGWQGDSQVVLKGEINTTPVVY